MNPFASFIVIHFEVGGDTRSLEHQRAYWPTTIELLEMANKYDVKLTLQFNPQWAEYLIKDRNNISQIRGWQKEGHEIGLHHHGYDHGDWDGYTNVRGKEDDPRFRASIKDMMGIMEQLAGPVQLFSGTISHERYDYPQGIKYDTEGIRIEHAKCVPKWVTLGGKKVIQVGMAFLSFEGDIESFKSEYLKSNKNEIFGVVTHEKDFYKNPVIVEDWFKFIVSCGETITTVSQIIARYKQTYPIGSGDSPLTFAKDIKI